MSKSITYQLSAEWSKIFTEWMPYDRKYEREPALMLCVGKKGVGKTFYTMKVLKHYANGNPQVGIKAKKVLIFDVNDEYGVYGVRAIRQQDILAFCMQQRPEVRRVRMFHDDGRVLAPSEVISTLMLILDKFRGGGILIEDISKIYSESYDQELIGSICTNRHRDTDLWMHFQSIGKIATPKIFANKTIVRFHKTNDSVGMHEGKIKAETEDLKLCESLVNIRYAKGDQRFCCYLDTERGSHNIYGVFTKEDFAEAIDDYLRKNYSRTVKPLMNEVDLNTGHSIYKNEPSVPVNMLRRRLFLSYYGNPN